MKWNIDFTIQLSVHRETIKTTVIMECEWVALMDDGWITLIDRVKKTKGTYDEILLFTYTNHKYQKYQNKMDNLHDNINNIGNYNSYNKKNNLYDNSKKKCYKNNNITMIMKINLRWK